MQPDFHYGNDTLTVSLATALANGSIKGVIADTAKIKINQSQQFVAQMVQDDATIYGVTTGFGILADKRISAEEATLLQYKILQSHSVGVGAAVPPHITRLMMIKKIHALAQGYSGIQK